MSGFLKKEDGGYLLQEDSGKLALDFALVSIAVTPANPTVTDSQTLQFVATGTYSDGSTEDITSTVAWSASPAGDASITPGGLYTAHTAAAVTVQAALSGVSGSTVVNDIGLGALVSQAGVETLLTPAPPMGRVSVLGLEAMSLPTGQRALVSQAGAESLLRPTAQAARVTTMGVEILIPNIYHVEVDPQNYETIIGRPVQYTAYRTNQFGTNRVQLQNSQVAWACDPSVGAITDQGIFTGTVAGTHQITATQTS